MHFKKLFSIILLVAAALWSSIDSAEGIFGPFVAVGSIPTVGALATGTAIAPGAVALISAVALGVAVAALKGSLLLTAARNRRRSRSRGRRNIGDIEMMDPEPILKLFEELDAERDCLKLFTCQLATQNPSSLDAEEAALMSLMMASRKGAVFYDALSTGMINKSMEICKTKYPKCNDSNEAV